MADIFDKLPTPATAGDIFDRLTPSDTGDAFDHASPPATNEDVMQAAGSEVLHQNLERRRRGLPDLNSDESGAIMDAFKLLGQRQPDKLRGQIADDTATRTQIARGVLGDAGAGAFQALTSYVPAVAGLIDPDTGLRLKQGQQVTANVNPASITGAVAGTAAGLGKFAVMGPAAVAEAAISGAGEQRLSVAEARKGGQQISGTAEALETGARGIVDGVLTQMFLKAGSKASGVVRSLIEPSVREALASEGLDTARKLAWTWAMDSLKVGALFETQYLADIGLEHLANPAVKPTASEAAKAAAFGIALPSVMGAAHGVVGRLQGQDLIAQEPALTPVQAGPTVPGTENYPIPPLVRSPGGPLVNVPRSPAIVTPPPGPGEGRIYPGAPGEPLPRQITPFPPVGSIHAPAIVDLIEHAPDQPQGVAPPPEAFPAGREPRIIAGAAVPDTAGSGATPETAYISRAIPQTLEIDGKPVDVHRFLALHEETERSLEEAGLSDDEAHAQATAAEHDALRRAGVNPDLYEKALAPFERTAQTESLESAPADLDRTPYRKEAPAIPRPKGIVVQEREIHQTPEGNQSANPHVSYDIAHRQSPGAGEGAVPLDAKGENLWIRPTGEASNAKRTLLVQFSTDLINADRPRTSADDYSDKLYATRDGFDRPKDFWELPTWMGVAARNKPNADVYVVRNLDEAAKFLNDAKYGEVAFSALDVNSRFIQQLLGTYKGRVAIGGYTDMTPFKGGRGPQQGDIWGQTREQHRVASVGRSGERPTMEQMGRIFQSQVSQVGAEVIRKVGSSDPQKIVDYYAKKYGLSIHVEFSSIPAEFSPDAWMATTKDGTIVADKSRTANLSKEQIAGTLRHEIEHEIDKKAGFTGTKEYAWNNMDVSLGRGGPLRPLSEALLEATQGHHQRTPYFEADYLHRIAVRDAVEAGHSVPSEVLKDYSGESWANAALTRPRSQPNVRVFDKMGDWIGPKFQDGTDYRHFRGTKVIPRLALSKGCLHNCFFCGVEGKGKAPTEVDRSVVDEQIASFKDLKPRLVYINDKTFGQAKNHSDLVEINKRMKAENPEFQGFIIQTSAAQMTKMTPEFLRDAGVKYVEMGVESYNDAILKSVRKPANEKMIDAAVEKIRASGAKFIPNIMIGLPGETPETYSHTLDFLDQNKDIISHVNAYNTALYEGSALAKKLGGVKAEADADENITAKSWQRTPEVDQSFHDAVMKFGSDMLDKTPAPTTTEGLGGEQGAVTPEQFIAGTLRAVGAPEAIAAAKAARDTFVSAAEDLQRTFSPGSRGAEAKLTVAEMRKENSRAARASDIRYKAYDDARRAFDRYVKVHGQIAADDFMDRINRGEKQADPALQALADQMDAERRDKVKQIQGLGVGAGEKFDENWFGRQWTNPDQARLFFRSRRPLTGSKTFLKGRVLESVAEGRAAGLQLVTDNPVEMHILKMGEMDKYVAGVKVIKALEANGAAKRVVSGDEVPPGWQRIHDQIGLYKAKNPVTHEVEKGSFYAPENVATLINNHLSPGLRNRAWFRTYIGAANWMNQFQLGMSGFHLAFTSADAIVSKFALSLRRLVNYGDLGGAIKNILGSPLAPITNAMQGHKGLMEWFNPGSQGAATSQIVSILEDAGARVQSDPLYRTHITDKMMSAWRQGNVLGALGRALLLPVEAPTRFIMDTVVPRQKLGVAMDIVRVEMANNPGISREALIAKARSAWDSADNRMGQLVYDNLFWNRMTKDIAMATVRSVGWNLGTFREIIGGATDFLRQGGNLVRGRGTEMTNRAAYLLALPTVHAIIGSFLNYVFTGHGPQNLRDVFFPQTGSLDEKGNPQRVSLPTYAKDIYHFGEEPLKTLEGKVHPTLALIHEMLTNKDFYGTQIRNEGDPVVEQVKQEALHVIGSLEPLSSRNLRRGIALGQSPAEASRSLFGLTPAPASLNETAAERIASDMIEQKMPIGARTQAAVDKATLEKTLRRDIKNGNIQAFSDAIQQGKLSRTDARSILKMSKESPLEGQLAHLSADEALRVWEAATPTEKDTIRVPMLKKLRDLRGRSTASEFNATATQYRIAGVLE
jgi:hypothetical protein